jgi:hypothetical protein
MTKYDVKPGTVAHVQEGSHGDGHDLWAEVSPLICLLFDIRGLDMVREFMQLEEVADALIRAGSGCIAAVQQLARSQVEL